MCLVMRINGAEIKTHEAIKLSEVSKSSTFMVRKDNSLVDSMTTLINNVGRFY